MNATKFLPLALAAALLVPQHVAGQCITCPCPVGTAFTYQGFLTCTNNAGNTVNVDGDCELEFRLFDCDTDPSIQQGPTLSFTGINAIPVQNGEFTVGLDFGDVYDGDERWLEITILNAPNPCVGANAILAPRRELTAAPYAIFAPNPGGNTLDQAYDQGGAGAGRTITADVGAVNIAGPNGLTVNGSVGIGTTSPGAKLEVAGTPGTDGIMFPDGTLQTTASGGGIPSGMIAMFDSACPAGWTRVSALDGKFLVGGSSYLASAGGSNTHAHSAGSYTTPSHNHGGSTGGVSFGGGGSVTAHWLDMTHTHPIPTQGSMSISGTSGSADNRPEYGTIILCRKD